MNKTIIININGIVFHIEEDAYEVLRSYMIDVKKHFGHSADSHEIVGDIENRIAEMFTERIVPGKKEVITMRDVDEVIGQMGRVNEFEYTEAEGDSHQGNPVAGESFRSSPRKLFRDRDDRILGGVASGLGHYFGIAAPWIRLIFVILFLTGGAGLLIYVVMWLITPVARTRADRMAMRGEAPNLKNFKRSFEEEMEGVRANFTVADRSASVALRSAGNLLGKIFIIFVKIIAVLLIVSICIGLVALVMGILVRFAVIDMAIDRTLLPMSGDLSEIRDTLLICVLLTVSIPLIALIALIVRVVFNRSIIGKYTGFTLFAIWLIASILSAYYAVESHWMIINGGLESLTFDASFFPCFLQSTR